MGSKETGEPGNEDRPASQPSTEHFAMQSDLFSLLSELSYSGEPFPLRAHVGCRASSDSQSPSDNCPSCPREPPKSSRAVAILALFQPESRLERFQGARLEPGESSLACVTTGVACGKTWTGPHRRVQYEIILANTEYPISGGVSSR